MEDIDLLASLETGYRSRQRRTNNTNNNHSTNNTLTRRIQLAVEDSTHNPPAVDNWRHNFLEQMNQDLNSGIGRSQAVSRLRQRMNELRRPLSTLDQSVHQPTSIKAINNHQTYLLYCGKLPTNDTHQYTNNQHHHQGCRKLISVRAVLMLPKSFHTLITHQINYNLNDNPEVGLLTSDSLPFPNAADRVDPITQLSFQDDPTNPFHPSSPLHPSCTCQKDYLGCLSCGNIVGHSITLPCDQCRDLAVFHSQFFYLSQLTALPRYTDLPIQLELDQSRPVVGEEGLGEQMSWAEAARRRKKDVEAGLVGSRDRTELMAASSLDPSTRARPRLVMSNTVTAAILFGSLVDHQPYSRPLTPSAMPPLQPSSSHPLSTEHTQLDRQGPVTLSRRPAVRLSLGSPASTNPLVSAQLRPRTSSSESWVLREPPVSQGFPPELLRLRQGADPGPNEPTDLTNTTIEVKDDQEGQENEQEHPSIVVPRDRSPSSPSSRGASRRQRPIHDDLDDPHLPSIRPGFGRVIRRRIHSISSLLAPNPPPFSSSSSSGTDPQSIGHLCAR